MEVVVSHPASVHLPFKGATAPPLSVGSVSHVPLVAPEPMPSLSPDAVADLERWAQAQKAELTRLTLALRMAESVAAKAETEAGPDRTGADGAPHDVLRVVNVRLARAVNEADEGIEKAQRDATLVLSAAVQHATGIMGEGGKDHGALLQAAERAVEPVPGVRRPPTASELWARAAAQVASAPPTRPTGLPRRVRAVSGTGDGAAVAGATVAGASADVGGSEATSADAARVYDLFWGGVPADGSARERLRRRSEGRQP